MSQENDTMKCEDYKAALTADPEFEDESGHVETCVTCREYDAEILALNEQIAAALQIDVPELTMPELPQIDTRNVASLSGRRSFSKRTWYAVAASVLLAAVVGIRMTNFGTTHGSLEEQVLAHLDREVWALQVTSTPVSDSQLARAVPDDIATMSHDAGLITYAQSCSINGNSVPHLVVQGEHGPITILLMPYEKVSESRTIDGVNIQGVILPVGNGSIAIIGNREEQLDAVKKNVLDSVMWST